MKTSTPIKRRAPGAGRPKIADIDRRITISACVDPSTLASLDALTLSRNCSRGKVLDDAVNNLLINLSKGA